MHKMIGIGDGENYVRRTWIDIDLDRIILNWKSVCSLTDAKVTAVIKSNAYGFGAVRIAEELAANGCTSFAVACMREGIELRQNGIREEILVIGLTEESSLPTALRANLMLSVGSAEELIAVQKAAKQQGCVAQVQIKVNTGMQRLGFDALEAPEKTAETLAELIPSLDHVRVAGMFTHLGLVTRERDIAQHDALMKLDVLLKERGIELKDIHICDSIAVLRYPEWHHSRVRVGASIFGVKPFNRNNVLDCDSVFPLAFRTTVAQVHEVPAGSVIGYGSEPGTEKPMTVATLCVGYGDGYPRHLSNGQGVVMIHGKPATVLGVICMDQMMVDVTGIPDVKPGDAVDLLGGAVSLEEFADRATTNRIECITILSRRPIRVYHRGGKIVTVTDDILGERIDYE